MTSEELLTHFTELNEMPADEVFKLFETECYPAEEDEWWLN